MLKLQKCSIDLLINCINNNTFIIKYVKNGLLPYEIVDNPDIFKDEIMKSILDKNIDIYSNEILNTLRYIVMQEFNNKGLLENFEPNEYGFKLEKLSEEIAQIIWKNEGR